MTIRNASWWSVSAVVLACGLVGCPAINTPPDTGSDALDAFEPSDAYRGRDVAVVDRDAPDAGHDSGATDAGADANTNDAAVCDCDDGIACTRDRCDAARSCVHWSACDADEICNTDGTCSATPTCASALECPRDWFCEELLGCLGGRCAYRWNPDRDGDGVSDQGCGGNDCAPLDRTIPRVETCNSVDDDCNGRIDDRAGLDSDPNNCGACRHRCADARRDICVAGMCVCSADHTLCDRGDGCFDLETDPLHCGSCDIACPDGSTCEAGLCRYRATWMHGVDVPQSWSYEGARVAPNGDVLFAVVGRPTRLFHQGRATETIPAAASPFPSHIVRLDRDGNLLGVTSIPHVAPDLDQAIVLRGTLSLAVTDAGFYFAGTAYEDVVVLGTTYTPGSSLVGYVPRTSSTIAWAHPLAAQSVLSRAGTRDGSLVLLVRRPADARPFESIAIRRFDASGAELAHDDRFGVLLFDSARSVFASSAGGFIVPTRSYDRDMPTPVFGDRTWCEARALVYGATGLLEEAVCLGLAVDGHIFAERSDASAWLVQSSDFIEFNRTPMSLHMGTSSSNPRLAAFDGSGIVLSDERPSLVRLRAGRSVETVVLPQVVALQEGSAWLLNSVASPVSTRPFLLSGATTTISRVDLPPIP